MDATSPSVLRTTSKQRGFAAFSAAITIAAVALAPAKEPSKTASEAKKDKGDLVRVWQIDEGEVVARRPLAHKTHSPDGRLFAGYYRDGWDEVISIHDAKTGEQIKRIVGHGDDVRQFKFSPDGSILASRCVNRGRVGWALWEVATGKLLMRLPTAAPGETVGEGK